MRKPLPDCPIDPRLPCLLIYDANCRLCVGAKSVLERAGISENGSAVRMIPYESREAMTALGERYRPGPPSMAYLVSPTGSVSQGVDAFLPFVSVLPGGRGLQWLLRWGPMRTLAGWGYGLIARHRYRLFGSIDSTAR